MPKPKPAHARRSFLLRCWQEQSHEDAETVLWHFSLREVAEIPQEHNFSSLEALIDFLLVRLKEEVSTSLR